MSYDLEKELIRIENELIDKLQKNLKKNIGINTTDNVAERITNFQASAILEIENFRKDILKTIYNKYNPLEKKVNKLIKTAYQNGASSTEFEILGQIRNGYKPIKQGITIANGFFEINSDKLLALQKEAEKILIDSKKAILRTTEDIYRQIIYKASVYQNVGFSTWECVDKATGEFLKNGISGITYKNGAVWNIASYTEMAIRTASVRAKLTGEGAMRENWGINTVYVSQYGACSKLCLPWQGRIYEDDVYTNLKYTGKYPRLSEAIENGLFHPNCRHSMSTFFEGINNKPKKQSIKQQQEITEHSEAEKKQRYYERKIRENKRMERAALSANTKNIYSKRVREYQRKQREYIADINKNAKREILRRDYAREKLR